MVGVVARQKLSIIGYEPDSVRIGPAPGLESGDALVSSRPSEPRAVNLYRNNFCASVGTSYTATDSIGKTFSRDIGR